MKKTFIFSALAGAAMFAGQASAGLLSIVGGEEAVLPSDFDPNPSVPGLSVGTPILHFTSATIADAGLSLAKDRRLVFTFMGSEAGFTNRAFEMTNLLFNEDTTEAGTSSNALADAGLVDFTFSSNDSSLPATRFITNGVGGNPEGVNISFALAPDGHSYYAMYGDSTDDGDRDDMIIKITAIPVPAGGVLLLTALGGLGLARRRRKAS
ncbi:VPLPA-CTERM sorting domain-containing protein [Roseobacter sp. S98]|uniref:VPLPA-CTERM sorting domain-containing protein n=1 Tax=Roseobacter algicola (ex Choi et al. 2025) (nom. illeg.) TaxID=3092138 RepID=UPI003F519079